jgi:hypothetical protein
MAECLAYALRMPLEPPGVVTDNVFIAAAHEF